MKAKIRPDLIADDLAVPIGSREKGNFEYLFDPSWFEYRYTGEDEEQLEIFHNGEWKEAVNIDFDFG